MTNNTITINLNTHYQALERLKEEEIFKNPKVIRLLARYVLEYMDKSGTQNVCRYSSDYSAYSIIEGNSQPGISISGGGYIVDKCLKDMNLYPKGSLKWSVNLICITMIQMIINEDDLLMSPYEMVELMSRKYPEYDKKVFWFFESKKNKRIANGHLICKEALAIQLHKVILEEFPKVIPEKYRIAK
jgi:hypothetical protein